MQVAWTKTLQRTAKSCGPGAATLALRWLVSPGKQRGQERPLPGESTYKPSNHCAGKAGMSRLYLSNPCAFFTTPLHTAMRAQSAPGFPCALSSKREQRIGITRAKARRGNAVGYLKSESAYSTAFPA